MPVTAEAPKSIGTLSGSRWPSAARSLSLLVTFAMGRPPMREQWMGNIVEAAGGTGKWQEDRLAQTAPAAAHRWWAACLCRSRTRATSAA